MKHVIYIVICLMMAFSNTILAANKINPSTKRLLIDLDLSINNKSVQKSKIVTKFGQSAAVAQLLDTKTGSYIEVMPSYVANNELVMQFKIAKIIDNEKKFVSKPIIFAQLGEKAKITMSDDEKNVITLAVSTDYNNYA